MFFSNSSPTSLHLSQADYQRHLPDLERKGMVNYFPPVCRQQDQTVPRPILLRRSQGEQRESPAGGVRKESIQSGAPVDILMLKMSKYAEWCTFIGAVMA